MLMRGRARPTLYSPHPAASTSRTTSKVQQKVAMSEPTTRPKSYHAHLETVIALARVLEHVERSPVPVDAHQYQVLVARLKGALSEDLPEPALNAILGALPAAAEVYENLHYQRSGLSRSPLERSVSSEKLAAQLLSRLSQASKKA